MKEHNDILELAKEASLGAGKVLMEKFGHVNEIKEKAKKDIVTEADILAENEIISRVKEKYPEHSIISEESGESKNKSEYTWIIDPLDGTSNFAYGMPLFGVCVAVLRRKEVVAGVINIPFFGELFHALKGSGAFVNGGKVEVSKRREIEEMMLLYDSDVAHKKDVIPMMKKVAPNFFKTRMLGAACVHFSSILRGNSDAWVCHRSKPWDIAAGCLLVEEGGGAVTDFRGGAWNPWSGDIVVSNGKNHEKILEIIGKTR